ncbi:MAG: type II toxin-antitoxin system RelE/ParE family toxin [Pyrinomonadaceae bacterium]
MKSGYRLLWSDKALEELRRTFAYLEENFSDLEIRRVTAKLEFTLKLIVQNPFAFPHSQKSQGMRRALVTRHNTIFYRISRNQVEILSFFSNRQDPDQLNF